jgi:hypothetical protein
MRTKTKLEAPLPITDRTKPWRQITIIPRSDEDGAIVRTDTNIGRNFDRILKSARQDDTPSWSLVKTIENYRGRKPETMREGRWDPEQNVQEEVLVRVPGGDQPIEKYAESAAYKRKLAKYNAEHNFGKMHRVLLSSRLGFSWFDIEQSAELQEQAREALNKFLAKPKMCPWCQCEHNVTRIPNQGRWSECRNVQCPSYTYLFLVEANQIEIGGWREGRTWPDDYVRLYTRKGNYQDNEPDIIKGFEPSSPSYGYATIDFAERQARAVLLACMLSREFLEPTYAGKPEMDVDFRVDFG